MTDQYPDVAWITDHGNWPSFSSDGTQVVYTQIGPNIGYRIAIVAATGGTPTVLDTGLHASSRPDWSWNPDTIAFTGQAVEGGSNRLWLIDSDGSNCRSVGMYAIEGNVLYPSWYQDQTTLVVANYFQLEEQVQVRLLKVQMGSTGTTVSPLTSISNITAGRPSVNPSGTAVAFAGNDGPYDQQNNQIWSVVPPSDPTQVYANQGRSPNWSPDGQWIVFESNYGSPSPADYAIFVIASDGSGAVGQLSDYDYSGPHPEWSRDQTKIVFGGAPRNGIGVIDTPAAYLPTGSN